MYDPIQRKSNTFGRTTLICLGLTVALSAAAFAQNQRIARNPIAAPASTAAEAYSQPPVAVIAGDYVIAPDDQLDISVEGHDEFNRSVTVLPDGSFDYFKHHIIAANLTVAQLTQTLTESLKRQLLHPYVTVSIHQAHVRQVSVIGTARLPGMYDFRPGMRVLDAIAASGGPTQAPEMTDATLVTDRGTVSKPVDLVKLMDGADSSLNVPMKPGDILLMQARNPADAMVLIRGQVAHEGQFPISPDGATIMAMLTQAGGATATAAITRVQLTHDGKTGVLNLRPTQFDSTAPVGQTLVTAGDTIAVPLNNAKYMTAGEINSRSVFTLPDGEPVTVTRAIAQAGGPTSDAQLGDVEIIRSDDAGKLTYIKVNVDDIMKKKSGDDPVLQDGDILYIPKRVHGGHTTSAVQQGLGSLFSLGALSNLLKLGF